MTSDKQVFKNPVSLTQNPYESRVYTDEVAYRVRPVVDEPKSFPYEDWDMEVIFTRRGKPIEVGSEIIDCYGIEATVIGIDEHVAWIRFDHNGVTLREHRNIPEGIDRVL